MKCISVWFQGPMYALNQSPSMSAAIQSRQSYGPPAYSTQTLPSHGRQQQQQPIPHYQPACVHQVEAQQQQQQQFMHQNGMSAESLEEQQR